MGEKGPPDSFEEANAASNMKLAVLSRYIGYKTAKGVGGGFLNATVGARARDYIDGHSSYGVDRVEGVFRRNGTPLIALTREVTLKDGRKSRFDNLWFVEIDPERAAELRQRVADLGQLERAKVICGDINAVIADILKGVHPLAPTLCVLDPYDPDDLSFETVRRVAMDKLDQRRHKIELFVNLPIGLQRRQARDPKTNELRPAVIENLKRLLGNDRWLGKLQAWPATATWHEVYTAMLDSFVAELKTLGYQYFIHFDVPPTNPMYALVFATDHDAALSIMKSAMKDWQRDPENPQMTWV